MEKKVLVGISVALFLIFSFSLFNAELDPAEEQEKVAAAYSCLEEKVNGECSSLSTGEKIFSLLAIDKCQSELIADSSNNEECWPDGNCDVKTTAQAVLALDNNGRNTNKAVDWLLSQSETPSELTWFLEIESSEATTCSIDYSTFSNNINIGEDKKISNNAGGCLTKAQDDYWLRVSPECYGEEFEISCDQSFLTTLLFKKTSSSTIHVLQESSSAAADGSTTEKVESSCLTNGGNCDYEGTLWGAMVLDSLGEDVSSYLPYLITLVDDNRRFIPEAFLYFVTNNAEYRTSILSSQKSNKWWVESGDKFYDTALALFPFQKETVLEKTNSKEWLLDVQDSDSCWENNVRNTAFILASIWPKNLGGSGGSGLLDCEDANNYCTSAGACEGEILSEYDCPALFRCCSVEPVYETCAELGGEICSSGQDCKGGTLTSSPDSFGQNCCVGGFCEDSTSQENECESNSGVCRAYGCNDGEDDSIYSCDLSGDTCCVQKTSRGSSYLWVWILLILIVIVTVGIIFRDSLKGYWNKFTSGRSKPGPRPGPGHGRYSHRPMNRIPERKILLPSVSATSGRPPRQKSNKELDDVLKKLKSMGK